MSLSFLRLSLALSVYMIHHGPLLLDLDQFRSCRALLSTRLWLVIHCTRLCQQCAPCYLSSPAQCPAHRSITTVWLTPAGSFSNCSLSSMYRWLLVTYAAVQTGTVLYTTCTVHKLGFLCPLVKKINSIIQMKKYFASWIVVLYSPATCAGGRPSDWPNKDRQVHTGMTRSREPVSAVGITMMVWQRPVAPHTS